jgi:predicted nuclease of predicted toxin-antitoxin system
MAAKSRRSQLKLLTDEMFPPTIAEQLRARGHDVEAVSTNSRLAGLTDPELFVAAQASGRTLVTEDVADFATIERWHRSSHQDHHGVVFTSDKRFPRGTAAAIGQLIRALDALLEDPPLLHDSGSWVHWLEPPPEPY